MMLFFQPKGIPMTAANAAGAAAYAARIQAIRASGTLVRVEPADFLQLIALTAEPLVVHCVGGFFSTYHKYLMGCRGLAFYTESPTFLKLPANCPVIESDKIWMPG